MNGYIPTEEEAREGGIRYLRDGESDGTPDPTPEQTEASYQDLMRRIERKRLFRHAVIAGIVACLLILVFGCCEKPTPLADLAIHEPQPGFSRGPRHYTRLDSTREAYLLQLQLPPSAAAHERLHLDLVALDTDTDMVGPVSEERRRVIWTAFLPDSASVNGTRYWKAWPVFVPKSFLPPGRYRFDLRGVAADGTLHHIRDGVYFFKVDA